MLAEDSYFICKNFDPSVDAGRRYYKSGNSGYIQVYEYDNEYEFDNDWSEDWSVDWSDGWSDGLNMTFLEELFNLSENEIVQPIVNSSCIGESPGKELDQCKFNGYLTIAELCNPCEVKEFKEQCEYLCERTTGPPYGPYTLK